MDIGRIRIAGAIIVLVAMNVWAEYSYSKTISVMGAGHKSCSAWNIDHNDRIINIIYVSWVQGYLVGVATYTHIDLLKEATPDSIERWLDKYCHIKPNDTIYNAADELGVALQISGESNMQNPLIVPK